MNRARTRRGIALVLLVIILALTGCWDQREVEDMGFVLVMGLDQGPEGHLMVTFVIAKPALLGGGGEKGGGGGGERPYLVLPVVAPSISTAMNVANSFAARQLTLIHTNAVVIGQPLAEAGVEPYMGEISRFSELRETAALFVARGTARELLDGMKVELEANPAKLLQGAMATFEHTGFVPRATIFPATVKYVSASEDAVTGLVALREKESGDAQLAVPPSGSYREGDYVAGEIPRPVTANPMESHGSAVFRYGKMVGTLTGAETIIYNMVRGTFRTAFFSIPDPADPTRSILMELRKARPPEVRVQWPRPDRPTVHIQLEVEGDLLGVQSLIDYTKPQKTPELERAVSELLESDAHRTFEKLQQYGADIMGIGLHARRHFSTYDQWIQYNWSEHFPELEIKVNVKASLRRVGLVEDPPVPR